MRRYTGVILIVLVALNLRPAVVAVGPLLRQIQDDLGLSGVAAGALTTLPVLFFGSFGLVAPAFRRSPRGEFMLVTSMALLVVALVARIIPTQAALFGGALLAGIAISIGNIAVPSIIKRDHPQSITTVTAVYTVAITVGAAVSSSAVVPLEHGLHSGWRLPAGPAGDPGGRGGHRLAAPAARRRGGHAGRPREARRRSGVRRSPGRSPGSWGRSRCSRTSPPAGCPPSARTAGSARRPAATRWG